MNINEAMELAKTKTKETGQSYAVRNTLNKNMGYYVESVQSIKQNDPEIWQNRIDYPRENCIVCWFNLKDLK